MTWFLFNFTLSDSANKGKLDESLHKQCASTSNFFTDNCTFPLVLRAFSPCAILRQLFSLSPAEPPIREDIHPCQDSSRICIQKKQTKRDIVIGLPCQN